jgi:hypothetical protein
MTSFYEALKRLPLSGEEKRRIAWLYETAGKEERRLLENAVWAEHERHFGVLPFEEEVILPAPPKGKSEGRYPWALVQEGISRPPLTIFGLEPSELLQHTVVVGRSGAGKTNALMALVLGILREKERPAIWVFDWKRSWRELLATEEGKDFLVFTVGRSVSPFPFNPLIPPPKVELDVWINLLLDIFSHAYFEGHGATSMLQRGLEGAYRLYGISGKERPDLWPSLADVRSCLEGIRTDQREALWLTSLNRALQRLTFGGFGMGLNVRRPFPLEELLKRDVILELGALSDPDRAFLCGALLLWIYQYMLHREGKREELELLIVFEESHFLFSRERAKEGETIIERLPRMVRELGVGLVLADQQPHLMSTQALANTYCKVAMNLAHEYDLRAIGAAMCLDKELKRGLGHLPVGYGIVKLQDRYTRPFLVRFPLVRLRKGLVTDKVIKERMRSFWERARELVTEGKRDSALHPSKTKPERRKKGKEEILKELVADLFRNPLSSHTERWQRLGLCPYEGSRALKALSKGGLVRVVEIPTPKGKVKIAFPTKLCIERHWPKDERIMRRGGKEHAFWLWLLRRRLEEEGFSFKENFPLGNGREIDGVAEKGGEKIAFEVETMTSGKSDSQAVANAKKCLEHGFEKVVILAVRHPERARRGLVVSGLDTDPRVEVWGPEEFFRSWWEARHSG